MDLQRRVDDRERIVDPHLARTDRVIDRVDAIAQHMADVVVGVHAVGENVGVRQRPQRGRFEQPPRRLEAGDQRFEILRLAEEIGSIADGFIGSALSSQTLPRLFGRSTQTWQEKPVPRRDLRPWSMTIAVRSAAGCRDGRIGRVFRKPPASATFDVMGPRRSRRYWAIAFKMRTIPGPTARGSTARRMGSRTRNPDGPAGSLRRPADDAPMRCRALQRRRVADAGQHQQLRRLERAGAQDDFAPRADLLRLVALRYSTPTARLPSNRMRVAYALVSTMRFVRLPMNG